MAFTQSELIFDPGLFSNRTKRASRRRWVDGNFVRFRDGVPAQMGGYIELPVGGDAIEGRPCGIVAWRPNSQSGRLAIIGTHSNAYLYDGSTASDATPIGFTPGRSDAVGGLGYGVGLYGDDTYGTERTSTTLVLAASSWSMDLFGEMVVACFTGDGKIYRYVYGSDSELTEIAEAPTANCVLVSPERHVFAFGAAGNPRLVEWSDREDYTEWTPSPTNRAGGYEMQVSTAFQSAKRVRGTVVAWTQSEVVMFAPSFNASVYSRETLSESVGCCGPLAVCVAGDANGEMAYWMADDGLYVFDGIVRRLNCELHDYIYRDINLDQKSKFNVSTNVEFSEVRFSYCSAASSEIDRCVVLCLDNGTWSKAHVQRTVWLDRGIFRKPLALNASGDLFEHEVGVTANGAILPSYVVSHPMMFGVGQQFTDIGAFWPDLDEASGPVDVSLITRDYSGDSDITHGPLRCTPSTEKVDFYASARQFQVKIAGTGSYWEIGIPLVETQAGGLA